MALTARAHSETNVKYLDEADTDHSDPVIVIPYCGGPGRGRGVGRTRDGGVPLGVGVGLGVAEGVAVGVGVTVGVVVGVAVGVGVGVPVGSPVMICTTPSLMALAQRLPLPSNSTATTCQ